MKIFVGAGGFQLVCLELGALGLTNNLKKNLKKSQTPHSTNGLKTPSSLVL
jgi:hypothetical protein